LSTLLYKVERSVGRQPRGKQFLKKEKGGGGVLTLESLGKTQGNTQCIFIYLLFQKIKKPSSEAMK
jgi:hypothetical protein